MTSPELTVNLDEMFEMEVYLLTNVIYKSLLNLLMFSYMHHVFTKSIKCNCFSLCNRGLTDSNNSKCFLKTTLSSWCLDPHKRTVSGKKGLISRVNQIDWFLFRLQREQIIFKDCNHSCASFHYMHICRRPSGEG